MLYMEARLRRCLEASVALGVLSRVSKSVVGQAERKQQEVTGQAEVLY